MSPVVASRVDLQSLIRPSSAVLWFNGRQYTVEIVLNDGRTESHWDCDPGMLQISKLHHMVVIVDGGPKLIIFITDGVLNDGDNFRQFGWGRYNPNLRGATRFTHRGVIGPEATEHLRIARGSGQHQSSQ